MEIVKGRDDLFTWGARKKQAAFLNCTKLENGSEQSDPLGGGIVDFALCRSGAAPAG
jgi:hypothetical protein